MSPGHRSNSAAGVRFALGSLHNEYRSRAGRVRPGPEGDVLVSSASQTILCACERTDSEPLYAFFTNSSTSRKFLISLACSGQVL